MKITNVLNYSKYAILIISIVPAFYAAADKVIIKARVLNNTCAIDSGSVAQSITLPDISFGDFQGTGTVIGEKTLDIVLTECGDAASNVTVTASGTPDEGSDDFVFKNTSNDNPASGIGLYFYQQASGTEKFKPDGSVAQNYALTPAVDNLLTFRAAYVSTEDAVAAGNFQSVVKLQVIYN